MTFSHRVKQELFQAKLSCPSCAVSFVHGLLYFSAQSDTAPLYHTEHLDFATKLAEIIRQDSGHAVVVTTAHNGGAQQPTSRKKSRFYLILEQKQPPAPSIHVALAQRYQLLPATVLVKSCCLATFLRGVFLCCGVMVNPHKEYHLEFQCKESQMADFLDARLQQSGHAFHRTTRKAKHILYLKESEQIEELLTYLGAVSCVFALMNIKIEKELRNHVNRITNCETANIQKTVDASLRQVDDIRFILSRIGFTALSQELQQTARLRLQYPEHSLAELCAEFPGGISRSGLNHRLKKLAQVAAKLKGTP